MLRVESIGISSEGNGAIEEEMPLLAKKSKQGSVVGWAPQSSWVSADHSKWAKTWLFHSIVVRSHL
jgi:hypothetical protein